jgi:hypothetical protein
MLFRAFGALQNAEIKPFITPLFSRSQVLLGNACPDAPRLG